MGLLFKWAVFAVYTVLIGYLAFVFGCVYEDREKKKRGKTNAETSKRNL